MAKILLADDNPNTLRLFTQDLTQNGHSVTAKDIVTDAIEALESDRNLPKNEQFEVALIDLEFTNYKRDRISDAGLDILAEAVQSPFLESIVLTAHGTLPAAISAINLGAFGYLDKATKAAEEKTFFDRLEEMVKAAVEMRNKMSALDDCLETLGGQILDLEKAITTVESFLSHGQKQEDPKLALETAKIYTKKAREAGAAIWRTRGTARALPLSVQAR